MTENIDLRQAMNAISDVIQNRPRPLREFDQIYMKAGDMVLQSELVAKWAADKRLAFIGDGDAISVCVAYLRRRNIIDYGPTKVTVFDFDERIVQAINRFADKERIEHLDARLYNCIDALPAERSRFDSFYTNPPWGQYNKGASVNLFVQRGMEAVHQQGEGMVIIADDADLAWTKVVLSEVQQFASGRGFFVSRMMPQLHSYHLDDAAGLRSCNLMFKSLPQNKEDSASVAVEEPKLLANFYGRDQALVVQYVLEKKRVDYGKASGEEYALEYRQPKT
jgi:predicted methyltransferase